MNDNQDTIPSKDISRVSSPGLGRAVFSRERVESVAEIKPAMFPFSEARKG